MLIEYRIANIINKILSSSEKDNIIDFIEKTTESIKPNFMTKDELGLLSLILCYCDWEEEHNIKLYLNIIDQLVKKNYKISREKEIIEINSGYFNFEMLYDIFKKNNNKELFLEIFEKKEMCLSLPVIDRLKFIKSTSFNFEKVKTNNILTMLFSYPNLKENFLLNNKVKNNFIENLSTVASEVIQSNKEKDLYTQLNSQEGYIFFLYHCGASYQEILELEKGKESEGAYNSDWNMFLLLTEKKLLDLDIVRKANSLKNKTMKRL